MEQLASLKGEMSLSTAVSSISNSEYSFPRSNKAMLSASPGCSGKLRFKLFKTLAFEA